MSNVDLAVPLSQRHFEDYPAGAIVEYGPIAVNEAEIVEFARRYDPQFIHVDAEAARQGPYGGLIASGWHTGSLMMRLLVDHFLGTPASLGSPGLAEIRWLAPVRPGDRLSVRVTILEARRSQSKPDRGVLHTFIEVLNQKREVVMSVKATNLMRCRNSG
jgi:acyl dehydratase